MSLAHQIAWGSLYLGVCFLVEIVLLIWCTLVLRKLSVRWKPFGTPLYTGLFISTALFFIIAAHTIQVWIWAVVWIWGGILPDWNSALYFSLVTYTTVGYGDIVLGEGLRIFATFASVAGLLAFGLSTAYLVALMTRLFEGKLPGLEDW